MRELTDHKLNGANEAQLITVLDEPGAGGACHKYKIELRVPYNSPNKLVADAVKLEINFQNGPVAEAGFNGVTQEALLAIVIDRLRSFQAGPFACSENEQGLIHAQAALLWLHHRTKQRLQRGVEGTSAK